MIFCVRYMQMCLLMVIVKQKH